MDDPYHFALTNCNSFLLAYADSVALQEKIALVLSQQDEFKNFVLRVHDGISNDLPIFARVSPVTYADMRELVPLQAADLVAYELQKELARQTDRPSEESRYGYRVLLKVLKRHRIPVEIAFRLHSKKSLTNFLNLSDRLLGDVKDGSSA